MNFYTASDKILMKDIEEDENEWKDISLSCTVRINFVERSILPTGSTDSVQSHQNIHDISQIKKKKKFKISLIAVKLSEQ